MDQEFQNDMDLLDATAREIEKRHRSVDSGLDYEPSPNDFEDEIEFRLVDGIHRTADRYVFFPGQLMDQRLLRTRTDFAIFGGEYFGTDYPALALSRYALFRCRITPVTLRPRPIPVDEKIKNHEVQVFEGQVLLKGQQDPGRVQYVKTFPGDQLEAIVFGARDGNSKGYAEIEALRGIEYSKRDERGGFPNKRLLNDVQCKIFPQWMEILRGEARLPKTLRGVIEIIGTSLENYRDEDPLIERICEEMLASCETFRLWGIGYLQQEAVRVRAGVNPQGGYVHRYSPIAELLLEQLEMKRESLIAQADDAQNQSASALAQAAAAMAETARVQQALFEKLAANQETISQGLAAAGVSAETASADPVKPKGGAKPK